MKVKLAEYWIEKSTRLIDGASFTSSNRTRVSVGLMHLSLEHSKGLVSCVSNEIFGSAFALFRCQFEAFVRGVWFQRCASEREVDRFLEGKDPPRINELLKAIESVPGFEAGALTQAKTDLWPSMNDYTHGGAIQINARNTETDIVTNYHAGHIEALLEYSVNLSYLCGVQVAGVCDSVRLANKLMDLHKEVCAKLE